MSPVENNWSLLYDFRKGGTVVQWLAPSPYSKKVLDCALACLQPSESPLTYLIFFRDLWNGIQSDYLYLHRCPHLPYMFGESWFPLCAIPGQGVSCLLPYVNWDRLELRLTSFEQFLAYRTTNIKSHYLGFLLMTDHSILTIHMLIYLVLRVMPPKCFLRLIYGRCITECLMTWSLC